VPHHTFQVHDDDHVEIVIAEEQRRGRYVVGPRAIKDEPAVERAGFQKPRHGRAVDKRSAQ